MPSPSSWEVKLLKSMCLAILLVLAAATASLAIPPPPSAQYTVTPLTPLDDLSFGVSSKYLAANGSVAFSGSSRVTNTYRAFVYDGTSLHELTLGGAYTQVAGINSFGHVVGISNTTNNNAQHAFIWRNATEGIIDLGTLGGSYSYPIAINDADQVTGYAATSSSYYNAFLWQSGVMTNLGCISNTNGYCYSQGTALNASGQVTGWTYAYTSTYGVQQHAFIWRNATEGIVDLGTLGGSYSYGQAINDSGQVAGYAGTTNNAGQDAFIWSATGGMVDLGTLGGTYSVAQRITSDGHVFGYSYTASNQQQLAFVYDGTSMKALLPGNATYSNINDFKAGINDAAQATGYAQFPDGTYRPFLSSGTVATDIGTLGGTYGQGYAINDLGQAVGWSYTTNNSAQHAFLYANGQMTDLDQLVVVDPNGQLYQADAINHSGQILADGYLDGFSGPYLVSPTVNLTQNPMKATPSVNGLSSTTTYGTLLTVVSGAVTGSSGGPTGTVGVTYSGLTEFGLVNPDGTFSVTLKTIRIPAASYALTFTYSGDSVYNPAQTTATLAVLPATPTIIVHGETITYDGNSHPATGFVLGVNGEIPGSPSFTYNGSSNPPVTVGMYAVVASFSGGGNYTEASSTSTDVVITNANTTS
jgi:probable HAF family extracellular repeat protein